jgi:heme A synthase
MEKVLAGTAILVSLVASILAIRAALVHVRNSQDDFIADIQRQSRWTTYAAVVTCVSVILQAFALLLLS